MDHKEIRITEQDRADAIETLRDLIPRYATELAVVKALEQHHPMWDESINLGYYRTFVRCSCGVGIWYGKHAGDPTWSDSWSLHQATVVREAAGGWSDERDTRATCRVGRRLRTHRSSSGEQ